MLLAETGEGYRRGVLQVPLELSEVPRLDVRGLEKGPVGVVLGDLEHVSDPRLGPAVLLPGCGKAVAHEAAAARLGLGPFRHLRQVEEAATVLPAALTGLC